MQANNFYYVEDRSFNMIGLCTSPPKYVERRGDSTVIAVSNKEIFTKDTWCFKDRYRKYRPATPDEIAYLLECIKADKYISKENSLTYKI